VVAGDRMAPFDFSSPPPTWVDMVPTDKARECFRPSIGCSVSAPDSAVGWFPRSASVLRMGDAGLCVSSEKWTDELVGVGDGGVRPVWGVLAERSPLGERWSFAWPRGGVRGASIGGARATWL
jgi:hypothetical protein